MQLYQEESKTISDEEEEEEEEEERKLVCNKLVGRLRAGDLCDCG